MLEEKLSERKNSFDEIISRLYPGEKSELDGGSRVILQTENKTSLCSLPRFVKTVEAQRQKHDAQ